MKKFIIAAIALTAATCVGVAVAAATGSFSNEGSSAAKKELTGIGRPTIRPIAMKPLRVKGTGFKPNEHVRLAIAGEGGAGRRRVTASDGGSFVAKLEAEGCGSISISAVGDRGSRASFNLSSFVCTD